MSPIEGLIARLLRGREGAVHCGRRMLDLYEGPLANPSAAKAERERLRNIVHTTES